MGVYPWGARSSLKVHVQIIPFPSVFLLLPSPFIRMLSPALSPLLHPRYHSFDSDITTSLHLFSDRSPCLFFLLTQAHALHHSQNCISKMRSDQLPLTFTLGFHLSCLAQLAQPLFFSSLTSYSSPTGTSHLIQTQIPISTTVYSRLPCNVPPIHLSPGYDCSEFKGLMNMSLMRAHHG